ncbi:MAG: hypothetical protein PHU12_02025 [Candidatus Aenigmarchaeota archaeon]|nr:hypothetical protein [Candidatus Aenigmarchaeota archaeon]
MKYLFLGLMIGLILTSTFVYAAVNMPKVISVQGKLTDATGDPKSGAYNFKFEFCPTLTSSTCTIASYTTPSAVSLDNGVFNIVMDPIDVAFDGPYYLRISVKGPDDSSYVTLSPNVQITSAGYAYTAAGADDFTVRNDLLISNHLTINRPGNGLMATFQGGTDDTNYEYINFYSGSTRYGLLLWNGVWNNCDASSFCVLSDNNKDLKLQAVGTGVVKIKDDTEVSGNLLLSSLTSCSGKLYTDSTGKILCGTDATGGTGGVTSFNTRTGAVTLTTTDVTNVADSSYVNVGGDTMTGDLEIDKSGTGGLNIKETGHGNKLTFFGVSYFNGKYLGSIKTMDSSDTDYNKDLYVYSSQNNVIPDIYVGDSDVNPKYKVWTEGNDGSGSGLDADTVDGKDVTPTYEGFSICGADRIPMGNLDNWMVSGNSYTGNSVCTHYGLNCKTTRWFSTTAGIGWSPSATLCTSTALQASWYPKFTTGSGSYIACCSLS